MGGKLGLAGGKMKRYWPLILFIVLHAVIFLVLFGGAFAEEGQRDSRSLFHWFAGRMFDGDFPYRDFSIEYQPGAFVFFLIPRLFAASDAGYHIAFAVQLLLLDILGLVMLSSLARRLGYSERGTLIGATVVLMALGPMAIDHFDFAAGILVLAAIYAFVRGWRTASWVILAMAAMTKVFPVILVPLFALYLWRHGERREVWRGGLVFAAVLVAIAAPFLWISSEGFIDSFTYHSERGLQIESTYASATLLGDSWGLGTSNLNFDHGSWNLANSYADTVARFSPIVMALALLLFYNFYWWFQLSRDLSKEYLLNRWLITFAAIALMLFLLTNKVFSPQYMLWLYPMVAIVGGRHRALVCIVFAAIAFLTQEIYPYDYPGGIGKWVGDHVFPTGYLDLVGKETYAVYIVAARNAVLAGLAAVLCLSALRAAEDVRIRP